MFTITTAFLIQNNQGTSKSKCDIQTISLQLTLYLLGCYTVCLCIYLFLPKRFSHLVQLSGKLSLITSIQNLFNKQSYKILLRLSVQIVFVFVAWGPLAPSEDMYVMGSGHKHYIFV